MRERLKEINDSSNDYNNEEEEEVEEEEEGEGQLPDIHTNDHYKQSSHMRSPESMHTNRRDYTSRSRDSPHDYRDNSNHRHDYRDNSPNHRHRENSPDRYNHRDNSNHRGRDYSRSLRRTSPSRSPNHHHYSSRSRSRRS